MKKLSDSRVARTLTSIFNVRKWADFDRTYATTMFLKNAIMRFFIPTTPQATQTFNEALKEYNIEPDALLKKQNALRHLSIFMCILAFGFLCYTIYLVAIASWTAALFSIVVMMLALVLAFRYHFWFYQIKQRKLGCTFQEWFRQGLLGERGNNK